jgi:hypothetical protein
VLDRKKSPTRHVLTEEELDDIGTRLEANPKTSLRLLFLQYWLEKGRAGVGTNLQNCSRT